MALTDERLGQVLSRRDHVRALPEVNPVAWLFLRELAEARPRFAPEIIDAGTFLLDLLGMCDTGAPRIGLHAAMRVLAEVEMDSGRNAYRYLAAAAEDDAILRLSLDALLSYSDSDRRRRTKAETDAVAIALYLLLKMVRDRVESAELERAVAG